MKITFEAGVPGRTDSVKTDTPYSKGGQRAAAGAGTGKTAVSAYYMNSDSTDNSLWENGRLTGKQKKNKSLEEIRSEAENQNLTVLQNYMTVMAHTLSEEDYAALSEEGFQLEYMDPQSTVTIVDKIKAQMVLGGNQTAGYTDDLDMETLAAAVGDSGLARKISQSFHEADIPLTEENVDAVVQTLNMAEELTAPGDGEYRYMVDNEMETNVRDYYQAKSSGAGRSAEKYPAYYSAGVEGYYARKADKESMEIPGEQIENVIRRAGLKITEETLEDAKWILNRDLPLTEENLVRYHNLKKTQLPPAQDQVIKAAAAAISEGKEAAEGDLTDPENIYTKAAKWSAWYHAPERENDLQLTARRQLEEVRLRMTAEVNVKLLRSGFSIDTAPMEELIEALKQAQTQTAEEYFPRDAAAVDKYTQYKTACEVIREIPSYPAEILGTFSNRMDTVTLEEFQMEGRGRTEAFRQAQRSYEALMTSPRGDMGDSIQKAFANVDDILADLGADCTKENRKAARILGYNRMAMNIDNLEKVSYAEHIVRHVAEKMTPAATLQMIRDGINPLEQSMETLQDYFEELPEEFDKKAEKYSRFLQGLEKRGEITEEERASYIGIYRLLHQIEKSDGAVVGALVNSQAELNFANLLSAVRSSRHKNYNVEISDSFGAISDLTQKGVSISDQIALGYGEDWKEVLNQAAETKETQEAFNQQKLQDIQTAATSEKECIALLAKGDIPVNTLNLLAAQGLSIRTGLPFQEWKERLDTEAAEWEELEHAWDKLDDSEDAEEFTDTYSQIVDRLSEYIEEQGLSKVSSPVDVRELQMMNKQLAVMGALAQKEEYHIPMYIGEELTDIHLTIERNTGEREQLKISLTQEEYGYMESRFVMEDGKLLGYFMGNTRAAVMKLTQTADIFHNNKPEDFPAVQIEVAEVAAGNEAKVWNQSRGVHTDESAGNVLLYQVAKHFLHAIKDEKFN